MSRNGGITSQFIVFQPLMAKDSSYEVLEVFYGCLGVLARNGTTRRVRWVRALDMEVTLHDKRIVMQVMLHYEFKQKFPRKKCYIQYALTVNPHIYVPCVKQFWNTATVKQSTDVTRLQALVDKKKVVISEAVIHKVLRVDDPEGVDCLPNEEIYTGLALMGYEKPSTKLTFYKAFFSNQWKFLIYTILQSMSAKRTSCNEFISAMASAIICLSTCQKFNFSKHIFDSLVRNVDSSSKFYMYPRFIQLIIQNQIGDLSTHTTKYISTALTQKVFANIRRIGKGFSGVKTPLYKGMLVVREDVEADIREEQILDDTTIAAAQEVVTTAVLEDVLVNSIPSPALPTPPPQSSQYIPSTSQAQSPPQ
nr:hypothetical protein [Tanacetum cinerariifolium]